MSRGLSLVDTRGSPDFHERKYTEESRISQGFVRCNRMPQPKCPAPPMAWRRRASKRRIAGDRRLWARILEAPSARGVRAESSSRGARGCRKTPVLSDGLWRRGDPGVAERPAFPWIASLTLAMTTAVRPKCKLLGSKPNQPDRFRRILFSNGSRRKLLPDVDAFGCLRSLRARSALDGVSWVQGG